MFDIAVAAYYMGNSSLSSHWRDMNGTSRDPSHKSIKKSLGQPPGSPICLTYPKKVERSSATGSWRFECAWLRPSLSRAPKTLFRAIRPPNWAHRMDELGFQLVSMTGILINKSSGGLGEPHKTSIFDACDFRPDCSYLEWFKGR